jgi:electron transport complex protein RnfG
MACLLSGIIIATTYFFTNPIAKVKSAELTTLAMKSLVKDADTFKEIEGKTGWYKAQNGDKTVAYIIPSETKGYGGIMKVLVAVTPDGKVIDYNITAHNETPGLGDGANKDAFRKQFVSKGSDKLVVVKDPTNKDNIQAMTGATISTKAITKAVKEAVDMSAELKEGK